LERIALSAQGDLQRILSAFFALPITIALVYSDTYTVGSNNELVLLPLPNPKAIASASPENPIIQNRQVHLQCSGKIVCTATSTVRITSQRSAHFFLEEKYAIGQMFNKLEVLPTFELVAVGFGAEAGEKGILGATTSQQLWRRYKLTGPELECEILEVFPSRDMFLHGERWLDANHQKHQTKLSSLAPRRAVNLLFGTGFILLLLFELWGFYTGRWARC